MALFSGQLLKERRGLLVAVPSGLTDELNALAAVLRDPDAVEVHAPKRVLRLRAVLIRRFPQPFRGLGKILLHALTRDVQAAKELLRAGVALLRGLPEPRRGLSVIRLDGLSRVVDLSLNVFQ